ncbi:GNAT family N-acetyltransferase [Streptomyces albidoflavus]
MPSQPGKNPSIIGPFLTRRAQLADHQMLNALHDECSLPSRYARYASARKSLTTAQWSRLLHPGAGVTWVTVLRDSPETAVAVTHLLKTDHPGRGELALLIGDQYQGQGLGTWLFRLAMSTAEDDPAWRMVTATFSAYNKRARAILQRHGIYLPPVSHGAVDVTVHVRTSSGRCR